MAAEAARKPGIGYSLPRREDDRFIRGQGTFVADVTAPRMAHMAVLRSPLARARIRSINATRAFTLPGVLVVITGELLARHMSARDAAGIEQAAASGDWSGVRRGLAGRRRRLMLTATLRHPAGVARLAVDRVSRRLGFVPPKASIEQAHNILESMCKPDEVYAFHVDLIQHGRRTCSARAPQCSSCPLLERCPRVGLPALPALKARRSAAVGR